MTGVTCPTIRQHPSLVAQAAATVASMMPGRFTLGVGSGENLNEHIYGDHWPPAPIRINMLAEAVNAIRTLWQEECRITMDYIIMLKMHKFTLPEELPQIFMAVDGPIAATTAGNCGDGMMVVDGNKELLEIFKETGGEGKPAYSEVSLSYAETDEKAVDMVYEYWPLMAIK